MDFPLFFKIAVNRKALIFYYIFYFLKYFNGFIYCDVEFINVIFMSLNINIVLNGPESEIPDLKKYNQKSSLWIGVDKGSLIILKNGFKLFCSLGDFDSVSNSELKEIITSTTYFKKYPSEKSLTDFQISLLWIKNKKYKNINVFGWNGGRIDQLLSNLMTFTNIKFKSLISNITFIDKKNWVKIYRPGNWILKQHENKKYVSFTSISNVKELSLLNFKYLLNKKNLNFGEVLSSNEFVKKKPARFSFKSGLLLVSQSND